MSSARPYTVTRRPLHQPLTTFLWEVSHGPTEVVATGECPECRCVTTRRWEEYQHVSKGPASGWWKDFDNGEPKRVHCHCTSWHVDRPSHVRNGCGAQFYLAMPPQGLSL
ncbi:hypothetical protein ABTY59_13440 [Streptomyces sp. NPDC096079]|uniref:hypothetical protein n=1 Tax=Streptomyces sp. NPDC096079 TaxID=3155820 RepID=UPI003328B3AD